MAKPGKFTDKIKWIEYYPSFINLLRSITGRNVIPMSYICRPASAIVPASGYGDFIYEYMDKAYLNGQEYLTYAD